MSRESIKLSPKEKMFDLSSILPTNNSTKCMEISEENLYVDIGA